MISTYSPPVEFRDPHLFLRRGDHLFRIARWPSLETEVEARPGLWEPILPEMRDTLLEDTGAWPSFEASRFELVNAGVLHDRATGQLCFSWAADRSELRLLEVHSSLEQFEATAPVDVWNRLQWIGLDPISTLEWAREVPDAIDLALHDRWLAAALARHWEFPAVGRRDWDAVRRIVRKRRRDIVDWLGFSSTEATANALRRVQFAAGRSSEMISQIRAYLTAIEEPALRPVLLRIPKVAIPLVRLVTNRDIASLISGRQVDAFARLKLCGQWAALSAAEDAVDLIHLGALDADSIRCWNPRHSHTESLGGFGPLRDLRLASGPRPTSQAIRPIQTVHELIAEAEEMRHCVGSGRYVRNAILGRLAFYHVHQPVVATLALIDSGGAWHVHELRGPGNADVSAADRAVIARCLGCAAPD